jgi:DNA-nicking Smr family endonuclease
VNDQELFERADQIESAKDEVLESLRDELYQEQVQEGDFTKQDAMDKYGLTTDQATRKLEQLIADGRLIKFWCRRRNYYRKVG